MRTVFPREVLNKLRWTEEEGLKGVNITYVHRGAPGDLMSIQGEDITRLERSFFVTCDAKVPYHRIRWIEHRGARVYEDRSLQIKKDRSERVYH